MGVTWTRRERDSIYLHTCDGGDGLGWDGNEMEKIMGWRLNAKTL